MKTDERGYPLIGNYNLAGTRKFRTHILLPTNRTACGIWLSDLRGDWQAMDNLYDWRESEHKTELHCKRCSRFIGGFSRKERNHT